MRRAPLLLGFLLALPLAAAEVQRPPSSDNPKPSKCCAMTVYDAKGHAFAEVVNFDMSHRAAIASVLYTLKNGDRIFLAVAPWYVTSDLAPGGSNVVFTTPDCSGNDAFAIITPQLAKRQAIILPVGTYPNYTATQAWLWVSDPFPTPTAGTIATVFHSQWDNGACSPYPAPGFTYGAGTIFGGVWVHRVEDLYAKFTRPFWIP